ncbi:dihydroorotate dehydrogenase (fumarate) [Strigomonas culicis]|uniref:Dihydroorotate dehydrogenase (Fumarate) n=1 Tax=Strigomonas culicis TaxID=28005 RepID=S9V273_9TRYP|nr:dihydroorotate dehydrogenase (fumarate) [Strigomonas culicis]|eukprot:EPY37187.1 dihydroorotate dehydrogenase (fumarate) [Strigomonas culicis]
MCSVIFLMVLFVLCCFLRLLHHLHLPAELVERLVPLLLHQRGQLSREALEDAGALDLQRGAHLHHGGAREDVREGVRAGVDAAAAEDQFAGAAAVEGVHVRERGGQHVGAAQPAEPVLRLDDDGLRLDVNDERVADAVDTRDEVDEREIVQHRRGGVEVRHVEVRRHLHTERALVHRRHARQVLAHVVEVIRDLRLAGHVGARQVQLQHDARLLRDGAQRLAHLLVLLHGQTRHGEEERLLRVLVRLRGVLQVVLEAVVRQPHRVDGAQRQLLVARLGVAIAVLRRATLRDERPTGAVRERL